MNKSFPKLSSKRLILDEITSHDAKDVFDLLSDKEVVKFYDLEVFTNLNQANELIAEVYKNTIMEHTFVGLSEMNPLMNLWAV